MGVCQGVAIDVNFHLSPPCPTLPYYALCVGHPRNSLTTVSGVVRPQSGRPAVVFYPFGHPTPYAYDHNDLVISTFTVLLIQGRMGRSIHGLPKVSPGPAMPNPSMPCGRSTPKQALRLFWGWPARRC
jgi:hypothetical protein